MSLSWLALAAVATVSLSGCAGGSPAAGSSPDASAPAPESQPASDPGYTPDAPMPEPAPETTPPPGSVGAAALPTSTDIAWPTPNQESSTTAGGGTDQLSACQLNRWESTGANSIMVRTFTPTEQAGTESRAAAVAMSFDDQQLADQAYATMSDWINQCGRPLETRGYTDARQVVTREPVTVPGGKGEVGQWRYDNAAERFESLGLIQSGQRVEVLIMSGAGKDANFPEAADPKANPMVKTATAAAAKLGS